MFHRFDRFELHLRGHTQPEGAALSCLRLKLGRYGADLTFLRPFFTFRDADFVDGKTSERILALAREQQVRNNPPTLSQFCDNPTTRQPDNRPISHMTHPPSIPDNPTSPTTTTVPYDSPT